MTRTLALSAFVLTFTGAHGTLTLPDIGTPAYSASCTITHAWEDGSARATCTEDGATYSYDPDGSPTINGRTRIPARDAGWYEVVS
jgi:hypothetical protein